MSRPLAEIDLDSLFTYHPPTDKTGPLHEAIGTAALQLETCIVAVSLMDVGDGRQGSYDAVNAAARGFCQLVKDSAPSCFDAVTAISEAAFCRNALNEAIRFIRDAPPAAIAGTAGLVGSDRRRVDSLCDLAVHSVRRARYAANRAIATGGAL